MKHSERVEQLYQIVDLVPNILEGQLRLDMNLGETAFRAVRMSAQAEHPEINRIKKDKQFRYKIIDENNTIQVSLEPTIGISIDWENEL